MTTAKQSVQPNGNALTEQYETIMELTDELSLLVAEAKETDTMANKPDAGDA